MASKIFNLDVREEDVSLDELMNADEVFFTGTAAVIAPIGRIVYKNIETSFKISFEESMTRKIRERLIDIQYENIEDPFGWVIPLGR